MAFTIGDLVTRKSYNHDILFRICSINNDIAILHGVHFRLKADAPLNDLSHIDDDELRERKKLRKEEEEHSFRKFTEQFHMALTEREEVIENDGGPSVELFHIPVKVLHIDGEEAYLKKCHDLYERLGLQVVSKHIKEELIAEQIGSLIMEISPQIVVITGHDAYISKEGNKQNLEAYRHSKYFVQAVKEVRKIVPYIDHLVIFAGACQSHFESLIYAGANFASSPSRVNIHALDPVYTVAKVAYTSFMKKVNILDTLVHTYTGEKGIGGVETRGLLRVGIPYPKNISE